MKLPNLSAPLWKMKTANISALSNVQYHQFGTNTIWRGAEFDGNFNLPEDLPTAEVLQNPYDFWEQGRIPEIPGLFAQADLPEELVLIGDRKTPLAIVIGGKA